MATKRPAMSKKAPQKAGQSGARTRALSPRGRDPASHHGFVNPPVYHASTVLYPSAEDFVAHRARYQYGRRGTPTTEALEQALQELEGPQCAGRGAAAVRARGDFGRAACGACSAGDHLLVTDSAYGPTRTFCDQILTRLGVTTTYYDPLIGGRIAALMQPNTRAVFIESPGSLSFEMQDIPAIAEAAHAKGALVLMDNTWATPALFPRARSWRRSVDPGRHQIYRRPFRRDARHGRGQRATVGATCKTIVVRLNGLRASAPDDVYLGLRGLRTLAVRLERH